MILSPCITRRSFSSGQYERYLPVSDHSGRIPNPTTAREPLRTSKV